MRISYFPSYLSKIASRHPKMCLAVGFVFTIIAALFAARIELRNDFVELLPDHMPEVKVIRKVLYQSGGLGYQSVLISSKDKLQNRAFLEALKFKLSGLFRPVGSTPFVDEIQDQYERLGSLLRDIQHYGRNPTPYWKTQITQRIQHIEQAPYVEYAFDGYDLSFFKRHQLLMVSKKDLAMIHKRIQRKIRYEVKRRQMGDMSLLEPDERPKDPGLSLKDIHAKYQGRLTSLPRRIEVREKDIWHSAMIVRPRGISTDLIFTTDFVRVFKQAAKQLQREKRFKHINVDFAGNFTNNLREFHGISHDLQSSIASTVVLLLGLLLLFFRRLRVLLLIPIPLLIGFIWTFAFAYIAIGHLNTATSFIGVLLLGLGIDYGIYLLHRYFQERLEGKSVEQAIQDCYHWTGKSVATAAITTAVGFFALLLCRFRGFSEFGLIAGMGIVLCLISMSTIMPALIVLVERRNLKMPAGPLFQLPSLKRGFPLPVTFVILALVVLVGAFINLPKVPFESNMMRLSFKDNGLTQQANKWKKFDKIFPYSGMSPIVFLAQSKKEARFVYQELLKRQRQERAKFPKRKPSEAGIRRVVSAFELVPEQQKEKLRIIRKIRHLMKANQVEDWAEDDPKLERVYNEYAPMLRVNSFGVRDLPLYLQRDLILYRKDDFEKVSGFMVVITSGFDLSNGLQVRKLLKQLKGVVYQPKPVAGKTQPSVLLPPSGEPIIFAELLDVIDVDSLRAILVALLAVLLLVLFDLRSIKLTILSLWPLATGLLGVSILLVFFDIRLNLFNMVVLPALLGINIDAGVHMLHRYREESSLGTLGVQMDLLGAITIASLTTVISFASLIIARHQGMQSVGKLALAGLGTGLIGSLIFLPALMEVIFRHFPLKPEETKDTDTSS